MESESKITEAVKDASNLEQVFETVSRLQFENPSSRLTSAVYKKIQEFDSKPDVRIALLGNFTLDLLPPHICTAFAAIAQSSRCYVAPYNQHYQEVLSDTSQLSKFKPNLIFLSLAIQELSPDIHYRFAELQPAQREQQAEHILDHVKNWIELASEHVPSDILVTNFVTPRNPGLGIADYREQESENEFYQSLNKRLRKILKQSNQAHLFDIDSLAAKIGQDHSYDAKMYYLAKILWSDSLLQLVSQNLVRFFIALRGRAKKCLVLDLDNTLWGGILGEEGVRGIKIGKGDPESEAFTDFQYKLRSLKQRGVILALCSKNNYDDVAEAFSERSDIPLNLTDFAATRIDWKMKHENIIELADELNIGLDSLVFIDDNPAEIALVRQMCPEVTSILLPEAYEIIPEFIDSLPYFEKLRVLDSDRSKTEQYNQNRHRASLKDKVLKLDDYLQSLGTNVKLRPVEPSDIPRVHQLFTKTNQFNLTTIRYSLKDIEEFLNDANVDLWCYSVDDTFGDLGLVGLLLVRKCQDRADVDSFVMSCRTMGRGVETAVINWLKDYYINQLGFARISSKYIPTKKNVPVKDLFTEQEFLLRHETENEYEYDYEPQAGKVLLKKCDWITFAPKV